MPAICCLHPSPAGRKGKGREKSNGKTRGEKKKKKKNNVSIIKRIYIINQTRKREGKKKET